jgi:hypothetical protein
MKRIGIAFVFVASMLSMAACGKSANGELESLKKDACACKDAKCAEKISDRMDALDEKWKDHKPSDSEMKLAGEIVECMTKATGVDPTDK